jgi:aspartate kinase
MVSNNKTIVMKFGGSSVANAEKIDNVCKRIISAKKKIGNVVVTVSAMGKTTDQLIELAKSVTSGGSRREMDVLLSTGEQVSIAMLAMALQEKGYESISFTGIQAGIVTDSVHSEAKIIKINASRIIKELKDDKIVIVAGFQGTDKDGNITTLGRGGSDTTAVAVAAALHADYCEIYTDVDGVYTTDPNMDSDAEKIERLSYDEMLELASSGAKVLHLRAVEFAKKYNVVINLRSSFNENEGTWIMDDLNDKDRMEKPLVTGVTHDNNQVKVTVFGLKDIPGIASKLFGLLAKEDINVDLIVQNVSEENIATISFTIKGEDLELTEKTLEGLKENIDYSKIDIDEDVAKVSIIGSGMQSHPGVASKMFEILAGAGINIEMISTSPIRISCIIRKAKIKNAVKFLHKGFITDTDNI